MNWHLSIGAVIGVVVTRAYLGILRSQRFAAWRREVWRFREIEARRAMLEAIDRGDREAEHKAERRVTLASARHIHWSRRA